MRGSTVRQSRSPAKIYLDCDATRLCFWLFSLCLVADLDTSFKVTRMAHVQGRSARKLHAITQQVQLPMATQSRKQQPTALVHLPLATHKCHRPYRVTYHHRATSFRHTAQHERAALSFALDSYIRVSVPTLRSRYVNLDLLLKYTRLADDPCEARGF